MIEFFTIVKDIILPIFILMAIGFVLQRKFQMDVSTLAKVNIYFLVPGFIFTRLYQTSLSVQLLGTVLFFFIGYVAILFVIAGVAGRFIGFDAGKKTTFQNSAVFFNSGNYGVPVNDLVFKSDPFAMSIQVIMLTLQNIFLFSYGIFSLQSVKVGKLQAALGYFKMPVLYAMLSGLLLNFFNVSVPSFLAIPANYIADAMISLALFTLGAQVAQLKIMSGLASVYYSLILRLLVGPMIALGILFIFKVDGLIGQALFVASAMPTSVNSAVIAQEYDNHPEYAAQIVLFSTLFSAFTVSLVIYLSRVLF